MSFLIRKQVNHYMDITNRKDIIMDKEQLKKFGVLINEQMKEHNNNSKRLGESRLWLISGLKDAVYWLGVSIDEKKYKCEVGFKRFTKLCGIDWELEGKDE